MSRVFSILNALDEDNEDFNINELDIVVCLTSAVFLMIKTYNALIS